MSFRVWYKLWVSSIIDLLYFNRKREPTDAQRERERRRRIRERVYGTMPYEKKQKRARRRSSRSVSEGKLFKGIFMLSVTSISILLIPFGFFDWGVRSAYRGIRRARARRRAPKGNVCPSPRTPAKPQVKRHIKAKKTPDIRYNFGSVIMPRPVQDEDYVPERLYPIKQSAPPTTVQDESKPRSTPLSESDVYIRKRLILADVEHCEREALDSLQIGSVLAFTVSEDNGTVTVTHRSDRVGYIGKQDALPFAAGLQLGRRIYGIITSIDRTAIPEKYELEAWFDGEGRA